MRSPKSVPVQFKMPEPSPSGREDLVLFLLVTVPGLVLAYVLAFVLRIHEGDALSRTYQAASVLYANPPALANVGFIWTPLPTLVQVPLVAIRLLATNGFSGQIVSVGFAGGALVMLNRLLYPFLRARRWRYPILAIYQLNPLILIYAVNGMTESMLIFWVLVAVYFVTAIWRDPSEISVSHVGLAGMAVAMAFLTRYEGVSLGLAIGATLLPLTLSPTSRDVERSEGVLLAFAAPGAYAVGLWLFFNWLIMDNPFYFMVGRGSNREQAAILLSGNSQIASLKHNLPNALGYVLNLLGYLYPVVFLVMLLLLLRAWLKRDGYALALALVTASFPAFQIAMHYTGQSFGWLRFHIYIIPLVVLGGGYLVSHGRWARAPWRILTCGLLLASSAMTVRALEEPSIQTYNEADYYRAIAGYEVIDNFAPEREMAAYLRTLIRHDPDVRILTDELRGDALIVFTGLFENFVGSRAPRFLEYVAYPVGYVDYLLASDVTDGSDLVAGVVPPGAQPPEYLELVYQTEGAQVGRWRLYQVKQWP